MQIVRDPDPRRRAGYGGSGLALVPTMGDRDRVALAAARFGATRLIDNVEVQLG